MVCIKTKQNLPAHCAVIKGIKLSALNFSTGGLVSTKHGGLVYVRSTRGWWLVIRDYIAPI